MSNTTDIAALKKWRAARTDPKDKAVDAAIVALAARLAALEQPTVPPVPVPGIPPMPAGDLLAKTFGDGTLAPFRRITYVDEHPGDLAGWANDYGKNAAGQLAPAGLVSFHPGYVRLASAPQDPTSPTSRWWGVLLSTGDDGHGGAPTFGIDRGYVEVCARLPGLGPNTWQCPLWLLDATPPWTAAELDVAEVLEDATLHFNILPEKLRVATVAPPADIATAWHRYGVAIAADHVTFTMDGRELGRRSLTRPRLNLLADTKVGFPWMGVWPDPTKMAAPATELAWIVASSTIPAGL